MIEKIKQSDIDKNAVAALADRPGAPGRYGVGGLSPGELKAHFDKLALLAIAKLNELIDALHGQNTPLCDELATRAVSLSDDRERMPLSDWIGQVEAFLGLDGTGGLAARIAALEAVCFAPPAEEEELVDDTELVAVIAAAIAAYDDVPADGFVVRSIRKSNRRKWLGA